MPHTKSKNRKASRSKAAAKAAKSNLSLVNLKVSEKDRKFLQMQANKYVNGNLSQWLRLAGTMFRPSKNQLAA